MQKDQQLKQGSTFVILVCGNHQVGKKTFVYNYLKSINIDAASIAKSKSYYTFYPFSLSFNNEITFPVEIRVLNSEEMDTDLKMIKPFFQGAMAAFVVTRLDDYNTFEEGVKWKEKVDLMCCLPNKFPLPIVLLINMCDKIAPSNFTQWVKDLEIDKYYIENQYFDIRYISNEKDEDTLIGNQNHIQHQNVILKDLSIPFTNIYDFVLGFSDIHCLFTENNANNGGNAEDAKSKISSLGGCMIV